MHPVARPPLPRHRWLAPRRRIALLAGVTAAAMVLALAPNLDSDAATRRVTTRKKATKTKRTTKPVSTTNYSIAIRNDVATVAPGAGADYDVILTAPSGLRNALTWDVPDLPSGYTFTVSERSAGVYRLRVVVPANSESSSTVYVLKARQATVERPSLFRIVVQAPPKPTAQPTTTTTVPVALNFTVKADVQQRSVLIGDTASYPISLDRKGYNGPITFTQEGAPPGAVVGFSPNPSTANTTLYVTPQAGTPAGRSLIIVTAKVGNESRSTAVELTTRRLGAFEANVNPSSVRTSPGNDARYTLSLSSSGAGLPSVDVQVKGLPSGASVRTTSPVATASTPLLVTTSKTTPGGTYPLTVTLTSGSFSRFITVTLIVDPQLLFSVTPDSTTVNLQRGSSTSLQATVARADGFTDQLGYQISGLPAGVQATYTWIPTGVSINFSATASAPTGSFPIEFTITGGGRTTTTALALVVV